jgi:hypothetical protein
LGYIGRLTPQGGGRVELPAGAAAQAIVEGQTVVPGHQDDDFYGCLGLSALRVGVPGANERQTINGSWPECTPLEVHPFTVRERRSTTTTTALDPDADPLDLFLDRFFHVVVAKENQTELLLVGQLSFQVRMNRPQDPDIFWRGACNFYRAPVTITRTALTIGQIEDTGKTGGYERTEAQCPHPRLDDEAEWLTNLLRSNPEWSFDGDKLTLKASALELVADAS